MMLVAATLLALGPAPALADDRVRAGELFKQGNELRLAGKYKEALEKYTAAYQLLPNFKIEYNTALVLDKLGDHAAAYMTYRSFLKSGAGKSPEKMLLAAREKVEVLKQKIAVVKVTSNVEGATIKVNGINVGKTPLPADWEMALKTPRTVGLWVEADGYRTFTKSLQLNAGQDITVGVILKPLKKPDDNRRGHSIENAIQQPKSISANQTVNSDSSASNLGWKIAFWTGLPIVIGLAVGSAVTGNNSMQAADEKNDIIVQYRIKHGMANAFPPSHLDHCTDPRNVPGGSKMTDEEVTSLQEACDNRKENALYSGVLGGLAGAMLIADVVFLYFAYIRSGSVSPSAIPELEARNVPRRWFVLPYIDASSAGMGVKIVF